MREVICLGIFIIPRKSLKDLDGTGLYHLERAGFNVKKTEVNWQEETNSLTGKRTIIVTERTTIVIAKTISVLIRVNSKININKLTLVQCL